MIAITSEIVGKVAEAIRQEASPVRIILFGSCARGEIGPDSDIDLLVVEDHPFGPEHSRLKEMDRLHRVASRFGVPTDILVYSSDEIEKRKDTTNHIVRHALREGKTLYERSRRYPQRKEGMQ